MDSLAAAAAVACAWSSTVGGLVPDAVLAEYASLGPPVSSDVSALSALMAASPAAVGANAYDASARVLTVATGSAYAALDLGNGVVRPAVLSDGASTAAVSATPTAAFQAPQYGSSWAIAGSRPDPSLTLDLGPSGVVTSSSSNATSVVSTLVPLRTYPNVVLQTLALEGAACTVTHALRAPDGAIGAAFSASTFVTPGSNVLVRAVGGECVVGTPASAETRRVLARAAFVVTGASTPVERWVTASGAYETAFALTPPVTLTALVAHGLEPAAAMRVLGAAADDLVSGALLPAHDASAAALVGSLRVLLTLKAQAAGAAALADDAAFHQLQLDAALASLAGAVPALVGLDADLWVVPPLLLLSPELARPFVQARVAELPAAREFASERGVRGALYVPPRAGSFANGYSVGPLPLYRSGLASLAVWNFFRATSDVEWLRESGYPVLRDVADAFASLLRVGSAGNALGGAVFPTLALPRLLAPSLLNSGSESETDDDAFTRVLAYWSLKNALEASYALGFAGRPAWLALFDLEAAFGRSPLLADVTPATSPLAATWPLGFCALSGALTVPLWPAPGDAPPPLLSLSAGAATPSDVALSGIARAAFLVLRAQAQPFLVDRVTDATAAHAVLTSAMRSAVSRPWGVVRDPRVCGAYLLMHLSAYGRLAVMGGVNRQRYSYAPFSVPVPDVTSAALPVHFACIDFLTSVDAGDFRITNELPWSPP